jgi:hypothetical protein
VRGIKGEERREEEQMGNREGSKNKEKSNIKR